MQNISNLCTFFENNWNNNDKRSAIYSEEIKNPVNIFTDNIVRACEIWNQITLNSIDISKENIKMYFQAMTSMESYHRNLIASCNSLLIPTCGKYLYSSLADCFLLKNIKRIKNYENMR